MNNMKSIRFPPPVADDMVRAIMDGRKTVTRRVMKPQPVMDADRMWQWKDCQWMDGGLGLPTSGIEDYAPYRPGDILYVRETWKRNPWNFDEFLYRADGCYGPDMLWRPSIHMPREAARIFLLVMDVKVERLQDITREESRINTFISAIEDNQTRMIFRFRFIRCLTWGEVAAIIGGKNSESSIKNICYRYLESCVEPGAV